MTVDGKEATVAAATTVSAAVTGAALGAVAGEFLAPSELPPHAVNISAHALDRANL